MRRRAFLKLALWAIVLIISLLLFILRMNVKSKKIFFTNNLTPTEIQKIQNDLLNNKNSYYSLEIDKKVKENCATYCIYYPVKFITNKYGDWAPASLERSEEGNYELRILL